jgi:glycerol-3-phosphate dehydrogenase
LLRDAPALTQYEFDLLVVGGGVCGAAILWDAALRGLSAALVERGDFGGATSAHSLKVVHGGIRYLQHLDVARVRESSRERTALLRIAPHLVHPLPVLVPTYGHGQRGPEALATAFLLLETLTSGRNRAITDPARQVPRARLISRRRMLQWHPELEDSGLTGAGMFWDGQLFNPPRLVWEFIRSAMNRGGQAVNYCEVQGFLHRGNRVVGVAVYDRLDGARFEVRAKVVVNAAGPFAEQLYVRGGLRAVRTVPLSRDLALVLRRPFEREHALALQTGYRDPDALFSRGNRHIFLVPWRSTLLVGVNSRVFAGDPDTLAVTDQELLGFLHEINQAASHLRITPDDVALVHAGLLPIGEGELIRENVSFGKRSLVVDNASEDGVDGLITAITNRFTMARGVAERTVDLAFRKLGRKPPRCRTAESPLLGGRFDDMEGLNGEAQRAAGEEVPADILTRLVRSYGCGYPKVLELIQEQPALGQPLGESRVLGAEVVYAIREEMAQNLADCVFRRTDLGTAGHPGMSALQAAADLAADELRWSPERQRSEIDSVLVQFRSIHE